MNPIGWAQPHGTVHQEHGGTQVKQLRELVFVKLAGAMNETFFRECFLVFMQLGIFE
ncbi:MAG: hypothetical protein RLY69_1156 [Verrucomicrobiota bacterium]